MEKKTVFLVTLYFLSKERNGITRGLVFCSIPFSNYGIKCVVFLKGVIFLHSVDIDLDGLSFNTHLHGSELPMLVSSYLITHFNPEDRAQWDCSLL